MCRAKHHIFQVLTKRSDRMLTWTLKHFSSDRSRKEGKTSWPENVWLGVSLENQDYTWRIRHLQKSPAYIRFISIEPLLSPISLDGSLLDAIQWVIVGGESGPRARPMKPEWVYEMAHFCSGRSKKDGKATWPQNVWLGVSVENQSYTWRIEHLQRTPATIKFLSIEPLLSSISMEAVLLEAIQWIIVGGESGPQARPMKPEWVCEIQNQCEKYHVPFFFKQWGAYDPMGRRVGKKKAGRTLDGRTWEEIPTSLSQ